MVSVRTNWGRFGAADGRGTLNLLTPEKVAAALARPRSGRVFELGTEIGKRGVLSAGRNATWHVTTQVADPADPGRGRAEDVITMHTHAHTHIDGLAHAWFDGTLYNGVPAATAVGRGGTRHAGVQDYGGIVGTAVVLDVAAVAELGPGTVITADMLRAAAEGLEVSGADVVLIRCGWTDVWFADRERFEAGSPGLGPDAASWVAEQDPAVLGMDNPAVEPIPAPDGVDPLHCHRVFLHDLGTPLIENLDLARVAAAGVREGLFVAAPLKIERGLGSPVNPLLIA